MSSVQSTMLSLLAQDLTKFLVLSGVIQLIIYLIGVPALVHSHASAKGALLQLMVAVLNAVEPLLPAVVVFIRAMALLRLKRHNILVSDQQKMMIAGHVDVVLFDKTGTLTADQV